MITAVLYDMGDIFFEAHLWRKWMYDQFTDLGLYHSSFADFYYMYEEQLLPVYEGNKTYNQSYEEFLTKMGIIDRKSFWQKSFAEKEKIEKTRSLYDGIITTLATLKQAGVTNVVVTDNEFDEATIREKILAKFDINSNIDRVITSKEAASTKAESLIFQFALKQLGCSADQVLFVGHDREEIASAKKCGIKTVEFNNYLGNDTGADYHINTFSELINLIK